MRRFLPWAALAGTALLLYAFRAGEEMGGLYAIRYGSFLVSRGELALRQNLILLVLPAGLLLAFAVAALLPDRLRSTFDRADRAGWTWAIAASLLALLASAAFRASVLGFAEVTDDENVYDFLARLLASGRLYVESVRAPYREFFDNQFMVNDGRWYGSYFVGHPAALALAMKLRVAAWLGPIEAAIVVVLTFLAGRRVFGTRTAAVGVGLLVLSPFFVALFATRLSQPTDSVFLWLLAYAAFRLEDEDAGPWWVVAAGAFCLAFFTRPQTALAFSIPLIGPPAWHVLRGKRRIAPWAAGGAVLVLLLSAAAFLGVNLARSGSPFTTGYQAYMAMGNPWSTPVGLEQSVRQLTEGLGHLNFWLFGWPLSFVFLPFFARNPRSVRLAAACILTTLAFAASGVLTVAPVGPVYYGELIPALALLSASGWERTVEWASRHARPLVVNWVVAMPLCFSLLGLVTFLPTQALWLQRSSAAVSLPYRLAEDQKLDGAIVFVERMPSRILPPFSWAYFHRNPSPDLSDPVIWVKDLGDRRNRDLMGFLGRKGYRLVLSGEELRFVPVTPG